MIYAVTGLMRSGTSMVMRSLEAGGVNTIYDESFDEIALERWRGKYSPNIYGFMEINNKHKRFQDSKFIDSIDDCAIKIPLIHLVNLPSTSGLLVICMRRNISEILASAKHYFQNMGDNHSAENINKTLTESFLERAVNRVKKRNDFIDILEIWYDDVLENPLKVFEKLLDFGVPIDITKCSTVPNAKYRHQKYD